MISVDDAQATIRNALSPLAPVRVSLEDAPGLILADDVAAHLTQPPFDASSMDGYAVRRADVRAGANLLVIGEAAAGGRFDGVVGEREAVRIFTGAPAPDGADCVIIQENVSRDGDIITITDVSSNNNIRKSGIDFRQGDILARAGVRLNGPLLALIAAGNVSQVTVRPRPKVALIANGDELVLPGETPSAEQIICSIPYGLAPMINDWGGEAHFLGIAPDDPGAIEKTAQKALACDLIVPIGGASVGERDYMRAVFKRLGFAPHFEKVAVKPGKPTWFGAVRDTPVLGLPGNPASALVTAMLFVKPAITSLLGDAADAQIKQAATQTAALTANLPANGPRETYLRARFSGRNGAPCVTPADNQDSSLLSVFANSNALIRRLAGAAALKTGQEVEIVTL